MVVGIAEVDRNGRHPAENHRPLSAVVEEVAARQAALLQPRDGVVQNVIDSRAKRKVLRYDLGKRFLPQAQHRLTASAYPQKRHATLLFAPSERQPEHVAVERDRPLEVAHVDVRLEQSLNHVAPSGPRRPSTWKRNFIAGPLFGDGLRQRVAHPGQSTRMKIDGKYCRVTSHLCSASKSLPPSSAATPASS